MRFIAVLALLSLGALPTPTASQAANISLPLSFSPIVTMSEQTCPPDDVQEMTRSQIIQDVRTLLQDNIVCPAARTEASRATSCEEILTSCPSGDYWIRSSDGTVMQVNCM